MHRTWDFSKHQPETSEVRFKTTHTHENNVAVAVNNDGDVVAAIDGDDDGERQ